MSADDYGVVSVSLLLAHVDTGLLSDDDNDFSISAATHLLLQSCTGLSSLLAMCFLRSGEVGEGSGEASSSSGYMSSN